MSSKLFVYAKSLREKYDLTDMQRDGLVQNLTSFLNKTFTLINQKLKSAYYD